jgi:plasmid stabilization system protein ParE
MNYRVIYSSSVRDNVRDHVRYLVEQHVSAETIERWCQGLFGLVDSLYDMPRRFAVDTAESKRQGFEVRKVHYGRYLVRYRVDENRRRVEVLSFIHGARREEA